MAAQESRVSRGWRFACAVVLALGASAPALAGTTLFYVPKPDHGAIEQIARLTSAGDKQSAALVREMIETPQAVWLMNSTAKAVLQDVRSTVQRAVDKGTVPVLVAYNLPYRECSQLSAGGATSVAEYEAWIDAVAVGIGQAKAVVILEPDGLGIIPWYRQYADTPAASASYEWCQPAEADPGTAAADRFAMLQYAVDRLKANGGTAVYLDATHTGWLAAGDAADRLLQAGVARADGFFLNVRGFELTSHLLKYGTWIAKCIAFASTPTSWGLGHPDWCASQYYPATANDFATWQLSDEWYTANVESQTWWYSPSVLKHFVVDTSRSGRGPWTPTASYLDAQTWCNPPGRGLGLRPTAETGQPLVDAYLWIQNPGLSDGQCYRGTAGPTDPEWGIVDPAAGAWFPEMALDLVHNADPPLP